jgi:hypothetical protein
MLSSYYNLNFRLIKLGYLSIKMFNFNIMKILNFLIKNIYNKSKCKVIN